MNNNTHPSHFSQEQNEITFQRCPHDSENPYVMISKKFLRDRDLSLSAKGLLAFLLSKRDTDKIFHNKLMYELNIGEKALTSSLNNLLETGYAIRTRIKYENGRFGPYKYIFSENRKFTKKEENPDIKTHSQCGLNQTPFRGLEENEVMPLGKTPSQHDFNQTTFTRPENAVTISNKQIHKENNNSAAAVVPFFSSDFDRVDLCPLQNEEIEIYDCLKNEDFSIEDKISISKRYRIELVEKYLAWLDDPTTKIKKSRIAALKWALEEKPEITLTKEKTSQIEKNKEIAEVLALSLKKNPIAEFTILSKGIEIATNSSASNVFFLSYDEQAFEEQLKNALDKKGFIFAIPSLEKLSISHIKITELKEIHNKIIEKNKLFMEGIVNSYDSPHIYFKIFDNEIRVCKKQDNSMGPPLPFLNFSFEKIVNDAICNPKLEFKMK